MSIKTKSFLQLQRPQNEINSVLQEDISIQIPTSPTSADAKSPNIEIPTSTITGASTLCQEKVERTSGGHKGMLGYLRCDRAIG